MKKIYFSLLIVIGLFCLTGCLTTQLPDIEVIPSNQPFRTAVYANDDGNNGFFVKRTVDGIIGCYNVSWNEENNKLSNTTLGLNQLVFNVDDEHLKLHEITDFEILGVYIDTYYFIYISANDKVYEYVLDYTNSSIWFMPLRFTYINFREVICKKDGFGRVINMRYNSMIIESDDLPLLDEVDNSALVDVYGMNYLYNNAEGHLVYQNISKNNPITHTFIEEEVEVLFSVMNNNYANILTKDNKIYKLDFKELTSKVIETENIKYMIGTQSMNYFVVIQDDKIVIYNYLLNAIVEIIPKVVIDDIVGIALSYDGTSDYKKLVLTTAHLKDNVLVRDIEDIRLS